MRNVRVYSIPENMARKIICVVRSDESKRRRAGALRFRTGAGFSTNFTFRSVGGSTLTARTPLVSGNHPMRNAVSRTRRMTVNKAGVAYTLTSPIPNLSRRDCDIGIGREAK